MKQLITNAIAVQLEQHGETVTEAYLAAKLWPGNTPKQQKANFGNMVSGRTKITGDQIRILVQEFPDTNGDYWLGLIDYREAYTVLVTKYKGSEFEKNKDIGLLYNFIPERKFSKSLYSKYL